MATKQSEIVVTDRRLAFLSDKDKSEGSTGLAIQQAAEMAAPVLDIPSNSLKDDAVFVPMGDRVAVKRIPEAEVTKLGIHLPAQGKTPAAFGVVIGIGQGRYNLVGQLIPVRVKVGAVVMFGKFAGTDIQLFGTGGKDRSVLSLREEEIQGVVMSKEDADRIAQLSDPEIVPVG